MDIVKEKLELRALSSAGAFPADSRPRRSASSSASAFPEDSRPRRAACVSAGAFPEDSRSQHPASSSASAFPEDSRSQHPASSSASAFPVDFKPVCARENVGGVIQGLLRKARVDDGISLLRCLQRVYHGVLLQFCRHICRKTPYSTTELQPEACTDMSDRKSVGPSHQGIKPESRFFVILKKLGSLWLSFRSGFLIGSCAIGAILFPHDIYSRKHCLIFTNLLFNAYLGT